MFELWQIIPLIQMSWDRDPDTTTGVLVDLIEYTNRKGYNIASSTIRDLLGRLTRGERIA